MDFLRDPATHPKFAKFSGISHEENPKTSAALARNILSHVRLQIVSGNINAVWIMVPIFMYITGSAPTHKFTTN